MTSSNIATRAKKLRGDVIREECGGGVPPSGYFFYRGVSDWPISETRLLGLSLLVRAKTGTSEKTRTPLFVSKGGTTSTLPERRLAFPPSGPRERDGESYVRAGLRGPQREEVRRRVPPRIESGTAASLCVRGRPPAQLGALFSLRYARSPARMEAAGKRDSLRQFADDFVDVVRVALPFSPVLPAVDHWLFSSPLASLTATGRSSEKASNGPELLRRLGAIGNGSSRILNGNLVTPTARLVPRRQVARRRGWPRRPGHHGGS
ncbi:hypothetical protein MRX96_001893 [Rhipicephalus microplus]